MGSVQMASYLNQLKIKYYISKGSTALEVSLFEPTLEKLLSMSLPDFNFLQVGGMARPYFINQD